MRARSGRWIDGGYVAWTYLAGEQSTLLPFAEIDGMERLVWWACLRRISEQAEHIAWLGKDKQDAVQDANAYWKVIGYLARTFP